MLQEPVVEGREKPAPDQSSLTWTTESTHGGNGQKPDKVMTFPRLVVRELVAFMLLTVGITLFSMFVDAPLEWIANPEHTPNPAKAPWYFLGLQELLFYFPPVVAGVVIPSIVIVALVMTPYIDCSPKPEGLWESRSRRRTLRLVVPTILAVCLFFGLYRVWAIVACTLLVGAFMLWPASSRRRRGMAEVLARQPLAHWLMTWVVVIAVVLTVIGTFCRGPGWSFVWPWELTRHP